jgi:hypothetical protein
MQGGEGVVVENILLTLLTLLSLIIGGWVGYLYGFRAGWKAREKGYETACFSNQEAIERSKK